MARYVPDLTRVQKVAIFLTALGPEAAANVLRHFPEPQAVGILQEIADLHSLDEQTVRTVLTEFQAGTDETLRLRMGPEYAALLIQKSFGQSDADRILVRLGRQLQPPPFAGLASLGAEELAELLSDESDQTAALVLAFLRAETVAAVLPLWPTDRAVEIGRRLMAIDPRRTPELMTLEQSLMAKHVRTASAATTGPPKMLAEILANVTDTAAQRILEALNQDRPELAAALRSRVPTFPDIRHLTDAGIRLLLTKVGMEDWAMALKGASPDVLAAVRRNVSSRAGERLEESMALLGPQPRRLVDEARGRILQALKDAETDGELMFRRGADEIIP